METAQVAIYRGLWHIHKELLHGCKKGKTGRGDPLWNDMENSTFWVRKGGNFRIYKCICLLFAGRNIRN